MEKALSMFAVMIAASTFALPALADGGAGAVAGAIAGANAGASATNNGGDAFGSASIAGAYCVDSAVIGPFALSKTIRPCIIAQVAESGAKLGTLTHGEVRALQMHVLEKVGAKIVYPTPTAALPAPTKAAAAAPAPTAALPATLNIRVEGKSVTLKGEQVARYESCGTFKLGQDGKAFQKPGC